MESRPKALGYSAKVAASAKLKRSGVDGARSVERLSSTGSCALAVASVSASVVSVSRARAVIMTPASTLAISSSLQSVRVMSDRSSVERARIVAPARFVQLEGQPVRAHACPPCSVGATSLGARASRPAHSNSNFRSPREQLGRCGARAGYSAQAVTGVGNASPAMRIAPNVEPSSRMRSEMSLPYT